MSMVINLKSKSLQSQSHRPDGENWMGDGWVSVPKNLEKSALLYAPFCELVLSEGRLTGIIPLEKPELPTQPNIGDLMEENKLLKAQLQAQTERSDFIEDCIAEMAMSVYGEV